LFELDYYVAAICCALLAERYAYMMPLSFMFAMPRCYAALLIRFSPFAFRAPLLSLITLMP